jgi:hypothetical protein
LIPSFSDFFPGCPADLGNGSGSSRGFPDFTQSSGYYPLNRKVNMEAFLDAIAANLDRKMV